MTCVENWIKTALERRLTVAGIMVSEMKTPMTGAILDAAGMQFAIIDQEHGAYGPDALAAMLAGFRGGRCVPMVRIPDTRREYFLTPLELGVAGILVPRMESRAQAEAAVRFCRYPPQGDRGVSLCRAHTGFKRVAKDEYTTRANAEVLLMVQIETAPALDNLDDILSVPGIDMAFIGPSDLAMSCGIDGSLRTPEMRAAVERIAEAAARHGVTVGIHTYDMAVAAELAALGVHFVSCNTDVNALMKSLGATLDTLRAALGDGLADPGVAIG